MFTPFCEYKLRTKMLLKEKTNEFLLGLDVLLVVIIVIMIIKLMGA